MTKILIEKTTVEQVLEALENHSGNYKLSKSECVTHNAAIDALREALAEQEQEQVEVQMRVGSSYWAKVDRNTPAEQLAKAQQLMQDYPGVYEMRTLYTSHSRRKTHE